ncbi:MAG TPA: Hsp20/alpha crystallin family protein [Gemmatimonadota bacterium]|nr:Hsp20/alpha crystallin family protein [Gemmatimonadota bacterium]
MTYLTRYRPIDSVFTLPRQLDRWMSEAFGDLQLGTAENLRTWFPATDVSETPDELTLRLEVPGLSREDVALSIERHALTVRGEKRQESTTENENFYRSERSYGSFERSFALPSHVDTDGVKASMENGVLTIRFPRREEAKARPIEIEGGGRRKEIKA